VSVARGRTLAFTDPDCVPASDWLERALAAVAAKSAVAVGETLAAGRSLALELLSGYARVKDEYVFAGSDPSLYYGRTNNMALQRSVFDAVGPFVEQPRGADTLLVRAVIERYGTEAVHFVPGMRVVHDELDSARSYLRKMHVYGFTHHAYRDAAPIRRLTASERLRLQLGASRRAAAPGAVALPLVVLLTAAAQSAWRLGRWRAWAGLRPPRGYRVATLGDGYDG
jgi:hypothetical protein